MIIITFDSFVKKLLEQRESFSINTFINTQYAEDEPSDEYAMHFQMCSVFLSFVNWFPALFAIK